MVVKRILVPLDGSPSAETILPQIRLILRQIDAEVILFQTVYICPSFYMKDYTRLRQEAHGRARAYLGQLSEQLMELGFRVRSLVGRGRRQRRSSMPLSWNKPTSSP